MYHTFVRRKPEFNNLSVLYSFPSKRSWSMTTPRKWMKLFERPEYVTKNLNKEMIKPLKNKKNDRLMEGNKGFKSSSFRILSKIMKTKTSIGIITSIRLSCKQYLN